MDRNDASAGRSLGSERSQLAMWILVAATVCLTLLAVVVIGFAKDRDQASTLVFNALVPLFGTWAGTVIAFYFSRENFESANQAVRLIAEQVSGDERLKGIVVTAVMKPRAAMTVVKPKDGGKLEDETLQTINDTFDKFKDVVTRLPLLDGRDVVQYVIHRSLFDQFKLERSAGGVAMNLATLKVSDLLTHIDPVAKTPRIVEMMKNFSVVDEKATLALAQSAMAARPKCQDVFVTKAGQRTEPVLGWITNSDIVKYAAL